MNSTELLSPSLTSKPNYSRTEMFWPRCKVITRSRLIKVTSNLKNSNQKTSKEWWHAPISTEALHRILRSTRDLKLLSQVLNVFPDLIKKWWMLVEPKTWNFSETKAKSKWFTKSHRFSRRKVLSILPKASVLNKLWHIDPKKAYSKTNIQKCSTTQKTW